MIVVTQKHVIQFFLQTSNVVAIMESVKNILTEKSSVLNIFWHKEVLSSLYLPLIFALSRKNHNFNGRQIFALIETKCIFV